MYRSRRAATVGVGRASAWSSSSTVTDEQVDWSTAALGSGRKPRRSLCCRRVDDEVAAPAPRATHVPEHRQQQQVLEPHHRQVGPVDRVDRPQPEDADLSKTSRRRGGAARRRRGWSR